MVVVGSMISTFFCTLTLNSSRNSSPLPFDKNDNEGPLGIQKTINFVINKWGRQKVWKQGWKTTDPWSYNFQWLEIIPTMKISITSSLTLPSINQLHSLGYQVFFFEQDQEFENFEAQESLHRTKHKILQLVAQSRSFLSSSGLKSWDWLCDLIDGLEVLSSQSSWLDSSRYSSSDNFSQLCYGFQAEIPSSHAISSCTNQEHKNHSP